MANYNNEILLIPQPKTGYETDRKHEITVWRFCNKFLVSLVSLKVALTTVGPGPSCLQWSTRLYADIWKEGFDNVPNYNPY